jgi:uncharacterized protein (TIGR02453 family)
MAKFTGFQPTLIQFLSQLAKHNNREWFAENKSRYESLVLQPALDFVSAFADPLEKVSPMFRAQPKRVGGSIMRVYRDTRFSKNKSPYKTNLGIHFRHELGKDVHAPGFYVHIAPDESFLGVGIWHPDNAALAQIRLAIDENQTDWKRAVSTKPFRQHFQLAGDSLQKPPRGFDSGHPLIDDLKRKDYLGVKTLRRAQVESRGFIDDVADAFQASRLLMRFLCNALRVPF